MSVLVFKDPGILKWTGNVGLISKRVFDYCGTHATDQVRAVVAAELKDYDARIKQYPGLKITQLACIDVVAKSVRFHDVHTKTAKALHLCFWF